MYRENNFNDNDRVYEILEVTKSTNRMAKNFYYISPFVDLAKWLLSIAMISAALVFISIKTNSCNVDNIKDCSYKCAEISAKKSIPYRMILAHDGRRGCWCKKGGPREIVLPEGG